VINENDSKAMGNMIQRANLLDTYSYMEKNYFTNGQPISQELKDKEKWIEEMV
jgi:hypothetical protein